MFEVQSRSPRSAKYWFSVRDSIEMDPHYQRRGGIWSPSDQSLLIDSMINDYDIPKLYIVDFSALPSSFNTDKKRYAVVDGKQRLEAIFSFFGNELPLTKGTRLIDPPFTDLAGLYWSDIEHQYPSLASKISEFPLSVMHIVTDDMERINQLFVRLNRGANLTGAETRNAMIGPLPKVIRSISEHRFFVDFVAHKSTRGQNLNTSAKLLRFELQGGPSDTKKRQLDDMVTGHRKEEALLLRTAEDTVFEVLERMTYTFGIKDPLLRSQGAIPVYYLFHKAISETGPIVRDFLIQFERELRETRKSEDSRATDLVAYDNAMRSTNDGWAYELRLLTLVKRFRQFQAQRIKV